MTLDQERPKPLYKSFTVWMTAAFMSVIGGLGYYGQNKFNVQNELLLWKDPSKNPVDAADLYAMAKNPVPQKLIFFYRPTSAKNSVAMVSNAAYYFVDSENVFHFGAVRGDAQITYDWDKFSSFRDVTDESRRKSELHKYPGIIYISPNSVPLNRENVDFAAYDLQFFCMGAQVKGFQAVAFANDHLRRLQELQEAAKSGELVAFVTHVDANKFSEYKPFDVSGAKKITGLDAELLLTQQIRIYSAVSGHAVSYQQNGILSADTISRLPEIERDYWVHLYSYSAARDRNMVLPNRSFGGGRDFKSFTPMMALNADKDGFLTIHEFGFENQLTTENAGILYAEPYVKIYTRETPLTEKEKDNGIKFAAAPLTESGWTLQNTLHSDEAKNFITKFSDEMKSFALNINRTPEIPERAIEIYCYPENDSRIAKSGAEYDLPSARQARFVMLDVARNINIFGMQVDIIYNLDVRHQLDPENAKNSESAKQPTASPEIEIFRANQQSR